MDLHLSRRPKDKTEPFTSILSRGTSPDHTAQKLPGLIPKHQDFSGSPCLHPTSFFPEPKDLSDSSLDLDSEGSFTIVQMVPKFCETPATRLPVAIEQAVDRRLFEESSDEESFRSEEDLTVELVNAAKGNDPVRCRALLDAYVTLDPNCSIEGGWTPLHFAASRGFSRVCEVLLDYGDRTHINCKTDLFQTPVHLACSGNHREVVQLLVRSSAELNVVDFEGNSPLHLAVLGGYKDIVHWLLLRSQDLTIKNLAGKTAADLADKEVLNVFLTTLRTRDPVSSPVMQVSIKESRQGEVNLMMTKMTPKSLLRSLSSPNVYEMERVQASPLDFEALQELGKGSFGEVYLVQKLDTMKLYAMKILRKDKILGQNLVKYAMTERNVLSYIKHPFIVGLNYAFQTSDKLFLILDYCPGGDLGWHLQREKRFNEYRARIYMSEVILALEELHRRDIIFRDLKPDNVLLDEEGHALLTDFGLSKEDIHDNQLAKSFCGSVAYLAPEMLMRMGHGKAVDWYLLGVLMYEMLVGQPPYFSPNKEQLFHNIQRGKLKLPAFVSQEARSLLIDVRTNQLLQRDPEKRLGASKRDAEEIKEHRFFYGVNWEAVARRELRPPIPPRPNLNLGSIASEKVFGSLSKSGGANHINGWSFVSS